MYISKRKVLNAIMNEPLRRGDWVYFDLKDKKTGKCPVCAVGAVLRRAGIANRDIDIVADLSVNSEDRLGNSLLSVEDQVAHAAYIITTERDYLTALSYLFEGLCGNVGLSRTRRILATFVKEKFPNKIRVNVCGR